jgi:CBS domain containing-hemolysin-like protein
MNLYPFDRIPVIDPKYIEKIIGTVTTKGIMKLLTETKRKLGFRKI